jgi:trimethylamine--corrinoid protein Co-methyltransferase
MAKGIEVDDDTLALDVIHKVGIAKDYLGQRHTLEHFKTEHFIPIVTDRSSFDTWVAKGSKTLVDRAGDEVRRILKEHRVEPVRGEVGETAARLIKKRLKTV